MSFQQFPQQQQVVQLLQRSLERGRLSHAYLFSGSNLDELAGVARTLAKALNCMPASGGDSLTPKLVPPSARKTTTSGQAAKPEVAFGLDSCDHCSSCRRIDEENHPDIQWIRPESKSRVITIDQMRELMQTINLKPTEARWKVAIIVAADRLNIQAANAFLKTLEEPPPQSIILLLSTDPSRMLETILSRCLRLSFSGDTRPTLDPSHQAWLQAFSDMAASREQGLLSRYRLLGTLLAKLTDIKAETDKNLTAKSPLERYDDIDARLRDKWEDELAAAVEAEYRRRRADLLLALQWWLRDVWIQALALGRELLSFPALGEAAQMVAGRITVADALRNIETIEQTLSLLGSNVQEALALEVGLLKLKL